GSRWAPGASFICRVRSSACAIRRSGAGFGSHGEQKCSPIQASSKPRRSHSSRCLRSHAKPSAKGRSGGCDGIMNIPVSKLFLAVTRFLAAVLARPPACDKQKRSVFSTHGDPMSLPNLAHLRQQLHEHGAIHVPHALDENSMRLARDAYQWSLCHPSKNSAQFQGTSRSPAKFYQDLLNPNVLVGYQRLLDESGAPDVVAELWD